MFSCTYLRTLSRSAWKIIYVGERNKGGTFTYFAIFDTLQKNLPVIKCLTVDWYFLYSLEKLTPVVFNHLFWQGLETCPLVLPGWRWEDRERYRHLVDRGQNATQHRTVQRATSNNKVFIWSKMFIVRRLRNCDLQIVPYPPKCIHLFRRFGHCCFSSPPSTGLEK